MDMAPLLDLFIRLWDQYPGETAIFTGIMMLGSGLGFLNLIDTIISGFRDIVLGLAKNRRAMRTIEHLGKLDYGSAEEMVDDLMLDRRRAAQVQELLTQRLGGRMITQDAESPVQEGDDQASTARHAGRRQGVS